MDAVDVVTGVVTAGLVAWRRSVPYSYPHAFELALKQGSLEEARLTLDELAGAPDTGGLWLPECYADLAQALIAAQHDDAIVMMFRAIELGWIVRRAVARSTPGAALVGRGVARRR